jgi:hypothetical protein
MTEDQYRELVRADDAALHAIAELTTQMKILVRLLNGDPNEDIPGVRPRLVMIERRMTTIPEDLVVRVSRLETELDSEKERRTNLEQRWLGIKWFLGGLGVTSVLSALTIARLLFGAP